MSGGMEDAVELFGTPIEIAPQSQHYKRLSPEPIAVIDKWELNFNLGNALKYIARCNYKGQKVDDLQKAITYLRWEIDKCKK